MGTIRVVDAFPDGTIGGACFTCRSAAKPGEPVVDLDHHIDFEGFALICADCTIHAARELGMIDQAQFEGLSESAAASEAKAAEADERARVATEAFQALLSAGAAGLAVAEPAPEPAPEAKKARAKK